MTRAGRAWLLLAALAVAALPMARAAKVYRWVDRQGVVHYGDSAPAANAVVGGSSRVKVIPVQAEPGAMVALPPAAKIRSSTDSRARVSRPVITT